MGRKNTDFYYFNDKEQLPGVSLRKLKVIKRLNKKMKKLQENYDKTMNVEKIKLLEELHINEPDVCSDPQSKYYDIQIEIGEIYKKIDRSQVILTDEEKFKIEQIQNSYTLEYLKNINILPMENIDGLIQNANDKLGSDKLNVWCSLDNVKKELSLVSEEALSLVNKQKLLGKLAKFILNELDIGNYKEFINRLIDNIFELNEYLTKDPEFAKILIKNINNI